MAAKSDTLQDLKEQLESVEATIEEYQRVRTSLVDVISFLGNQGLQDLTRASHEEKQPANGQPEPARASNVPAIPQDGIDAVRKALAARSQD